VSKPTLEQEVARLAAIEDIKQLKARYAAYCDDQYDPDGIASLFVEDGVWDGGEDFGRHEGRAKIHAFFEGVSSEILQAAHLSMNPIITVVGNEATGRWRLLCPCTIVSENGSHEASWILAEYDEEYVKQTDRWLFRSLRVKVNFNAPHARGWVLPSS
jgi:hypothetical protein